MVNGLLGPAPKVPYRSDPKDSFGKDSFGQGIPFQRNPLDWHWKTMMLVISLI